MFNPARNTFPFSVFSVIAMIPAVLDHGLHINNALEDPPPQNCSL
jgi:hypothetical protein